MANIFSKFLNSLTPKNDTMNWITLDNVAQLDEIVEKSNEKPQLIFKHSTRCSVSTFAKRILTSEYTDAVDEKMDIYYLDLIAFRDVSNAIEDKFSVMHQSPQVILIKNGKAVYNASHSDISLDTVVGTL
jgi:bacillithiol system protein YtxJ